MALITSSWTTDVFTCLAVLISFCYWFLTRNFNYWKKKGVPFNKPIPLFGNFKDVILFRTSIGEYFAELYKNTKGPYQGLYAFDEPWLMLKDPNLIKAMLVKDFNYFNDRAITSFENIDPVGTHNLFIIKNPEWKTMRTKLSPVFSSGKIKMMFNLMNNVGKELGKYIDTVVVHETSTDSKEMCLKYTTDVITSCAFGIQSNCLQDENARFRQIGKKLLTFTYSRAIQMSSYFFAPGLVKTFGFKFFDPECSAFLRDVFNESLKHREETKVKRNDLIDILLDLKKNNKDMDGDKLVAQAAVFFSAGFESSSSLMSFTLYELCKSPEIQEKLRNDIKTTLNKHNGELSYECLHEMAYLDMVCQETLRKYPPLPFLDRRCVADYKIPGTDITLEKGTPICVPVLGLHYDPNYFPDPQKYDPERFSEEKKRNYPFGAYMPFGEGPHNCIGTRFGLMNSKVGLVYIMTKFEVEKSDDTPMDLKLDPKGFLVTAANGLPIKFKRISIAAA